MSSPARRSLPDNLDPLVDTLSNVVGILVIVVALTQIQVGDALTRVAELDLLRIRQERIHAFAPAASDALEKRRAALSRRTDVELEESPELARQMLSALSALPAARDREALASIESLSERLENLERTRDVQLAARDRREGYAERLQRVPKNMVARLPDPVVVQGKESWIVVRYGRIYLLDRERLFDRGSRAIGRILDDGNRRQIRIDEFEAAAIYLRKRDVGDGNFRWSLRTQPNIRVELTWRSKDAGLDHDRLAVDPDLRAWLAARSPDLDFIRFQVWGDSFEAYLAAREAVEAAGFRAGWSGHETEEELALPIRFGPAAPPIGPIVVD